MTYFLSERPLAQGDAVELTGEEARHVAGTRRIRPGEAFALQDPQGRRFRARLLEKAGRGLWVRIGEPLAPPALPPVRLILIQAAPKARSAEWIIQKATEIGVAGIVFFAAEHSPLGSRELTSGKTRARWERIAWEACKQCGRHYPPEIAFHARLALLLDSNGGGGSRSAAPDTAMEWRWLLDTGPGLTPSEFRARHGAGPPPAARLLVGPEGGFTDAETALAREAGYVPLQMGELVMRAETAALTASAVVLHSG